MRASALILALIIFGSAGKISPGGGNGVSHTLIPTITGQNSVSVNEDNSVIVDLADLLVDDVNYPTGYTLTVYAGSDYSFSGTEVTPDPDFFGTLTVPVSVNDGVDESNTFNLSITVDPVNDQPSFTKGSDQVVL